MFDKVSHEEDDALLQLKLEVPRQPSSTLDRLRLRTALDALGHVPLVLVVAPAGFGKTTLLAQWRDHLRQTGSLAAWLTLDETDGVPRQFLIGVIYALRTAGLDIAGLAVQAERGLPEVTVEGVGRAIHAALSTASRPVAIFLDDYHRAAGQPLDDLIGRFIGALPTGVRLFISSRIRPEIDVSRLLVQGVAYEFASEMLRFTPAESRKLLSSSLGDVQLEALVAQIEGWPVALQLARVLSTQESVSLESLSRLTARGGHLSAFLTDQILKGLSHECASFLLETSILERFNVPIVDSMRDRTDSWQILDSLAHLQSFLTPLDADNNWYRYHHLFADYLQAQLRQRNPAMISKLHLSASRAFEQSGHLFEAVRHAREAGDFERCATLIEAAGGWRLVLFGGMGQLGQLLTLIPQAERLSHPRLLVASAYLSLKTGDIAQARATFDLVAKEADRTSSGWTSMTEHQQDVLAVGVLLTTYEDNDIDEPLYDAFCALEVSMSDADGLTRGVLECAGAVTALALGKFTDAERLAREGMSAMRSVNSMLGLNYCYLHAGQARFYRGDLRTASAYLGQAQAMAVENFGADSGLKAICDVLLGEVDFWRTGAGRDTRNYGESLSHIYSYDGWFDVYSAGLDVRFRMAMMSSEAGDIDAVIADADELARTRGLKRLAAIIDAYRVVAADSAGQSGRVRSTVSVLERAFPIGCWKNSPALWRPYQEVARALILDNLSNNSGHDHADQIASDLIACAAALEAKPFSVRALLLRALVNQHRGRHEATLIDLRTAVSLSVDEQLAQPFLECQSLSPAFAKLRRDLRQGGGNPLEADFLSGVIEMIAQSAPEIEADASGLSLREQEVVQELDRGLTNKEIARSLDMTEHTVKFHLKHIFAKFGVDRRAHALTAFRRRTRKT